MDYVSPDEVRLCGFVTWYSTTDIIFLHQHTFRGCSQHFEMYLQGWMKYHPIFVSVYFLRLHRSVSLTADIFFLLILAKLKVVLVQSLSKSSTWKKYTAGFMFCFFILMTYYLPALCFSSGTFPPQVLLCYLKSKKRRRALKLCEGLLDCQIVDFTQRCDLSSVACQSYYKNYCVKPGIFTPLILI